MTNFEKMIGLDFKEVSAELESFEVNNNAFELELEEGIEERFFVKAKNGSFELILDKEEKIQVIFLHPKEDGSFLFNNYSTETGKNEIRNEFGSPDQIGEPIETVIISQGGYDRYNRDIVYHFEYLNKNQTNLKLITLMSVEIAP